MGRGRGLSGRLLGRMDVIFLVEVEGGQTGRAVEVEASEGIVVASGQGRIQSRLESLQAKTTVIRR